MNQNLIGTILKQAEKYLRSSSDAPRLDAERMLLHVLGQKESSRLAAHEDQELTAEQLKKFEGLAEDRATGKPLAYILGEWEFYGRKFYVTPDVLVPRPETENLIDAALPFIDEWREKHPGERMVIADLGTGSGIIAVTLALESTPTLISPSREGEKKEGVVLLATDISQAALEVATKNAQRYGVAKQIEFIQEDMATTLAIRKIDLIVSNPPYVRTAELNLIPPQGWNQGLKFEPRQALDGGPDGQDFIRQIAESKIPAVVETTGGIIKRFNF